MRKEIECRPAVIAALALCLGLATTRGPLCGLFAVALAAVFRTPRAILLIGLLFGIGIWLGPGTSPKPLERATYIHEVATISAGPRASAQTERFELETSLGKLVAYAEPSRELSVGDRIAIDGLAYPQAEQLDSYRLSHGLIGEISVDAAWPVIERGPWLYRLAGSWRRTFRATALEYLSRPGAQTLGALAFNEELSEDRALQEKLRKTGTIHIISASGLQVVLFASALQFVLGLLPIPRGAIVGAVGLVLALYCIGAGLEPPIVRSALMWIILASAYLIRREPDLFSALGVAAIVVLLWRPISIMEIGFYLSFGVVAAFALFTPNFPPRNAREALARSAQVSSIAWIASMPLVAWQFGIVSWVAIPANLLIGPVIGPILSLAMLAYAIAGFAPAVSAGIEHYVVGPLVDWVRAVADVLGSPGWAASNVPAFSAWWLVPIYGAMLMLWRPRVRPAT